MLEERACQSEDGARSALVQRCRMSTRSVHVLAASHSFPSSPLGFLKEYPSDRMNFWGWRVENTMSAGAKTAADSRERGRPRAVPDVFCAIHLRGVSICVCAKKDGSAFLAKRTHCAMVQSRLTRAREQNHSLHLRRHVRLAPFCTWLSWLVIASTIVFCDCGHRELHRLPTSPPRWWIWPQRFDTAVHGVDELAETLSPIAATGGPPNTTYADMWPWEQETCRLCTTPLETGILHRSSTQPRSSTNNERGERDLHDKEHLCRLKRNKQLHHRAQTDKQLRHRAEEKQVIIAQNHARFHNEFHGVE